MIPGCKKRLSKFKHKSPKLYRKLLDVDWDLPLNPKKPKKRK